MTEEIRTDRTSKSMIGMPVYSIQEGIPLGLIKQILISGKSKAVEGFLVEKRRFSREEKILPFSAVSGFGEDTITVERQNLLERKGTNQQVLRAIRSPLPIIGARVFTAGGKTLGKVEEYRFSVEDGSISGLEIAGDGFFRVRSLVDGRCIIAIAPRTIMLKDEALETAIALESGFMAGMETAAAAVLEKASDIKSNASEAGRKLSSNFNEAMSRLKQRSEEGDRELAEALGLEAENSCVEEQSDVAANPPEEETTVSEEDWEKADNSPGRPNQR